MRKPAPGAVTSPSQPAPLTPLPAGAARVDVDIFQKSTEITRSYSLDAIGQSSDEVSGLQDHNGFLP